MEVFTPQKLANATNQSLIYCSVITKAGAHQYGSNPAVSLVLHESQAKSDLLFF